MNVLDELKEQLETLKKMREVPCTQQEALDREKIINKILASFDLADEQTKEAEIYRGVAERIAWLSRDTMDVFIKDDKLQELLSKLKRLGKLL